MLKKGKRTHFMKMISPKIETIILKINALFKMEMFNNTDFQL